MYCHLLVDDLNEGAAVGGLMAGIAVLPANTVEFFS